MPDTRYCSTSTVPGGTDDGYQGGAPARLDRAVRVAEAQRLGAGQRGAPQQIALD